MHSIRGDAFPHNTKETIHASVIKATNTIIDSKRMQIIHIYIHVHGPRCGH